MRSPFQFQRAIGNQAGQRFARLAAGRMEACPSTSTEPDHAQPAPAAIQRLTVGASDDDLERDADRIAEQVLAGSGVKSIGGSSGEKQPPIMRKSPGPGVGAEAPPVIHAVLAERGRPLDADMRAFMGARLGHDFSRVRVHADAHAAESARAINAVAYTVGEDIAFDSGRYAPGTPEGRHLLAHELTHVVQQAGSATSVLQRAEHGTYVSRKGSAVYLDTGFQFYKTWGYPNVKRVDTIQEILNDLDTAKTTIDGFRIVSHGASVGIETGLMTGLRAQPSEGLDFGEWFTRQGAEFTTEDRFRKHWTDLKMELVSESAFQGILQAVQPDKNLNPVLVKLGAATTTPARDTPLGILLRAMVDKFFLGAVRTDAGGGKDRRATIKNRAALDAFIKLRIDTYSPMVVGAAARAAQAGLKQAIADFQKGLPAAFTAAGIAFGLLTPEAEKRLADPYLEPGTAKLSEDLSKSITESGAGGGPFLKKLRSVRGKIGTGTHIEIRGCNIGNDTTTLDAFRGFFGAPGALPSISAPDLFQYFFALNFATYGDVAADTVKLSDAYTTASTGVAQAFEDRKRILSGEMTRVQNEQSLDELAKKFGWKVDELKRWNPEIVNPAGLAPGQTVWLVMRRIAPAGIHQTLKDFCRVYVGDEKALADLQAANPALKPDALAAGDMITVPAKWQAARVASAAPGAADFMAAIRGGETVTAVDTTVGAPSANRPITHMDNAKRADALATWLAAQQFDPKGRSAAELSKLYAGRAFEKQGKQTFTQFLSRGYPNIVDPIFPEDPRYAKHIIRRP